MPRACRFLTQNIATTDLAQASASAQRARVAGQHQPGLATTTLTASHKQAHQPSGLAWLASTSPDWPPPRSRLAQAHQPNGLGRLAPSSGWLLFWPSLLLLPGYTKRSVAKGPTGFAPARSTNIQGGSGPRTMFTDQQRRRLGLRTRALGHQGPDKRRAIVSITSSFVQAPQPIPGTITAAATFWLYETQPSQANRPCAAAAHQSLGDARPP